MADKQASKIDWDAVAYAAIKGFAHEHAELRPGRDGLGVDDFLCTKMDGWTAFTMVRHWPTVKVLIDSDQEGGQSVEWYFERVSDTDDREAIIVFHSRPEAVVHAELAKIRAHATKHGDAKELATLTPYRRVWQMCNDYEMHLQSIHRAEKQDAEARKLAEQAKARAVRKAEKWPPKKGSDEQRVLLTAKAAWDIEVKFGETGSYRGNTVDSSSKALIARLRDPVFFLADYRESKRDGAGNKLPAGTVKVVAEFHRDDDDEKFSIYTYLSKPSASLIEELELKETPDPKTPARTMKTRRDTI